MPRPPKLTHEIRDPVHYFIELNSDEREVLGSRPLQRLRDIHQLALSYLVYPGATHRRFEHSLGTMHLASDVFDVVTRPENVTDEVRQMVPEIAEDGKLAYWRSALRMAALFHDVGHLPFSHAAEHELLPDKWSHERLSRKLILSQEMTRLWGAMTPPLRPLDVVKLAVGKRKADDLTFSLWEEILSEVVVGDAFGADRMDYLLRDSHHIGVAYGHFDHHRLTQTLRILPGPPRDPQEGTTETPPALGVEEGGLHSAEALLLARYFMFSQVYFHPVRRVYDLHLIAFLNEWLDGGKFSTLLPNHLAMTDNEVLSAIADAAANEQNPGAEWARRIHERDHYKRLFTRTADVAAKNPLVVDTICREIEEEFGEGVVLGDEPEDTKEPPDFPVLDANGVVVSSLTMSDVLQRMPPLSLGYVFVRPDLYERGGEWMADNMDRVTRPAKESEEAER